jgi:hypothetical protein
MFTNPIQHEFKAGYCSDFSLLLKLSCGDLNRIISQGSIIHLLQKTTSELVVEEKEIIRDETGNLLLKEMRYVRELRDVVDSSSTHLMDISLNSSLPYSVLSPILLPETSLIGGVSLVGYNFQLSFNGLTKQQSNIFVGFYTPEIDPYYDGRQVKLPLEIILSY